MCGQQQSVLRLFGRSEKAKDLRPIVQGKKRNNLTFFKFFLKPFVGVLSDLNFNRGKREEKLAEEKQQQALAQNFEKSASLQSSVPQESTQHVDWNQFIEVR